MSPTISTEREPSARELAGAASTHFKLALIGAALRVREVLEAEHALGEFPFLEAYAEEAAELCGAPTGDEELLPRFRRHLARWMAKTLEPLPFATAWRGRRSGRGGHRAAAGYWAH